MYIFGIRTLCDSVTRGYGDRSPLTTVLIISIEVFITGSKYLELNAGSEAQGLRGAGGMLFDEFSG